MAQIPDNSPDIEKWLKLIRAEGVGPVAFGKLLTRFGSVDAALGASVSGLTKVEGIGFKTAERIASTREKFDTCAELERAGKLGVWMVHIKDPRYPPLLKQIYDPPPVMYIKGTLGREDNLAIAIVGSRRCSLYGQEQASRLAHLLAASGFTIVSGLARGIDTAAHQGALAAEGRTLAVQGCGLANIFPPENGKLFELISLNGACISELPLQYEPLSENFPPRNRIIGGLCLGTIVIEAGLRSGALITARTALENNREVMAVPGKIDSPVSKGPHRLIKQGATCGWRSNRKSRSPSLRDGAVEPERNRETGPRIARDRTAALRRGHRRDRAPTRCRQRRPRLPPPQRPDQTIPGQPLRPKVGLIARLPEQWVGICCTQGRDMIQKERVAAMHCVCEEPQRDRSTLGPVLCCLHRGEERAKIGGLGVVYFIRRTTEGAFGMRVLPSLRLAQSHCLFP